MKKRTDRVKRTRKKWIIVCILILLSVVLIAESAIYARRTIDILNSEVRLGDYTYTLSFIASEGKTGIQQYGHFDFHCSSPSGYEFLIDFFDVAQEITLETFEEFMSNHEPGDDFFVDYISDEALEFLNENLPDERFITRRGFRTENCSHSETVEQPFVIYIHQKDGPCAMRSYHGEICTDCEEWQRVWLSAWSYHHYDEGKCAFRKTWAHALAGRHTVWRDYGL
jgi:hypothetical protein